MLHQNILNTFPDQFLFYQVQIDLTLTTLGAGLEHFLSRLLLFSPLSSTSWGQVPQQTMEEGNLANESLVKFSEIKFKQFLQKLKRKR